MVASKPLYAAQIALYQAYMEARSPGISANPALFTAINKDTAELHHELVPFDGGLAQRHERPRGAHPAGDRGGRAAAAHRHLRPITTSAACPWAQRCWSLPA